MGIYNKINSEDVIMGGRYQGSGDLSRIRPDGDPASFYFQVKVKPSEINRFLRFMDGFTHLAFITTVEPQQGLIGIHTTRDTHLQVREIINNLQYDKINFEIV